MAVSRFASAPLLTSVPAYSCRAGPVRRCTRPGSRPYCTRCRLTREAGGARDPAGCLPAPLISELFARSFAIAGHDPEAPPLVGSVGVRTGIPRLLRYIGDEGKEICPAKLLLGAAQQNGLTAIRKLASFPPENP